MTLTKPPGIESDPFKSAKWDELTEGRRFAQSDAPALSLLCQWHKIVDLATEELDNFGSQTAYTNDIGDLREFPQIGTLKKASAEIRALNKQLRIDDEAAPAEEKKGGTVLSVIQGRYADRGAGAKAQGRAG